MSSDGKKQKRVLIYQIPGIKALICEDSLTCREGRMWSMVEWVLSRAHCTKSHICRCCATASTVERAFRLRGVKLHVTTMSEQSLYPLPPSIPSRSSSVGQRHDSEGVGKFKVRTPVSQRRGKDAPNNEMRISVGPSEGNKVQGKVRPYPHSYRRRLRKIPTYDCLIPDSMLCARPMTMSLRCGGAAIQAC